MHSRAIQSPCRRLLLTLALAASGCARYSLVGTSGQPGPDAAQLGAAPDSAVTAAQSQRKHRTVITLDPGVTLSPDHGMLGDIDGDGFDDFLIPTETYGADGAMAVSVYLFYGKAELAPSLSTADADAVFPAGTMLGVYPVGSYSTGLGAWALGDINGDGLADFSLAQDNGVEIVLGTRARFAGVRPPFSSGLRWDMEALPKPFADGRSSVVSVRAAGDVNADGFGDILVTASTLPQDAEEANAAFGLSTHDYLVLGRSGNLPTGLWDPHWAVARFGTLHLSPEDHTVAEYIQPLNAVRVHDLDGDGYDDLVAHADRQRFVFYGGPDTLVGELTPENAHAELELSVSARAAMLPSSFSMPNGLGDLDGDGASDMLIIDFGELAVVYGSTQRWVGRTPISTGLRIALQYDTMLTAAAGDIDNDGLPELVIGAPLLSDDPTMGTGLSEVYVIRGNGKRPSGDVRLADVDRLFRNGEDAPNLMLSGLGVSVAMAGDIDGDGSFDVITPGALTTDTGEMVTAVYLIPSTPLAPK